MAEKSSVFDMIGPVMIGPSSSHTAGVVRIGLAAYKILGGQPDSAEITFYNSFARTYEGHGSDRAILAGLMNFQTDDKRIKDAIDLLEKDATLKNPEHKNLHYFLQHQKNHGGIWGKIS